jgi:hypothetical protein
MWKASMMTKAGFLALVKSMLMAILLHKIMVIALQKKVLKQIEMIARSFLWLGVETLMVATVM